jgi:PAS domain S-box-containing protein
MSPSSNERKAANPLADAKRLLAELETHKAEIELQNEELIAAQAALQEARDRFAELYENAPVGYVVLDASGIVRQANRTWRALLNRGEDDVRGIPFADTIFPEDAPLFRSRFRAIFRSPTDKQIVVRMLRRGAAPFHAQIEARARAESPPREGTAATGAELMVTVSDISELQRARERAERLNGILRAIRSVNQLIAEEDDPRRLIEGACANLTEALSYHNAWIALLDSSGSVAATANAGLDGCFGRLEGKLRRGEFTDCMRRALDHDGAVAVLEPGSDCRDCPLVDFCPGRAGLARRLAFAGRTYGILAASVPADYAGDGEELALFGEIAADLGFALHNMEMTEQARRDQQRMEFVIEGTSLGTWEWNVQTNETVFNDYWADMLGYTLHELTPCDYTTWERLVHPDDLARAAEALKRCAAGRTLDYNCEFRMRHKDGHWIWILDRGRIMTRDAAGKPLSMFGTHTDITDIKQAERLIESFFDEPMNLHLIARLDGTIMRANKAWETTLGYASQDLVGRPFMELVHPDDVAASLERMAELGIGKPVLGFENRYRHRDGRYRTLVWSASFDKEGENVLAVAADVTEQKEQQERIALLGRMLDEAPAAISIHDTDGRFVFSNRQNMLLHGYETKEEFLAVNLHQLDVPESEARLNERFRQIAEQGEARFEVEHVRKDGSVFPLEITAKGIDWYGQAAVLSIGIDITERKRAEEKMNEMSERLQAASEASLDAFFICRAERDGRGEIVDFVFVHVNTRAADMLGMKRGEILGQRMCELLPVNRTHGFFEKYRRVVETGEPLEEEFHLGDTHVPAAWHYHQVVKTGDGIAISHRNIDERKQAEEELERSRAELQAIYDSAPIMFCVVDRERRVVYANPAFMAFVGASAEALHGGTACGVLGCATALDTPGGCGCGPECADCSLLHALEDTLATGTGHTGIERRLTIERDGCRKEVALLGATAAIRGADGNHALLCLADVTENWQMQQQLMQAQKMESVGQLAGGVAHDFNNMLHAILGYTELVASQLDPAHSLHTELGEIKNAAGRAAELTRQLLAFARKQTSMPRPLDLNTVVNETLAMLRRLVGETIHLLWKPGPGLWTVLADPTQVGMVLTNLCVNARDAIGGEGHITVETRNARLDDAHPASRPGEYVVLAVADDGCGMTREVLDRVFDPFFTTKEVGKGTGLGLASVHGIAEQNGGFVQVASEPGKGTVFEIFLPRHHAGDGEPGSGPAPVPAALPRGTETILVAEDEAIILSVCRALLTKLGYRVLAARTPTEAIAICREQDGPIHLLLTDVVMPEMNGRRLVALARELRPDIPCLYMSGYTAGAIAQRDVIEEGLDFLQKPFSNRQLAEKVRQILDRSGNPQP